MLSEYYLIWEEEEGKLKEQAEEKGRGKMVWFSLNDGL
jgi:hypothetical protein